MSQDIIADTLNQIMNAKKCKKTVIVVTRSSKLLIKVLEIAKDNRYIEEFSLDNNRLSIKIGSLHECKAIKPRYYVGNEGIAKYMKRFLPAKDLGVIIISTNQGVMTHQEAIEKKIGGCLISYFY
ncbi:MAG TPA: 30S ribosomal protein S8 [Candidatus Paceibacterota bacterium]|nr:30S ribosomal protein S8 [Candidatus Paceibacterota bacterium]